MVVVSAVVAVVVEVAVIVVVLVVVVGLITLKPSLLWILLRHIHLL